MRVVIGDYLKARELFYAYTKDSKESFDKIKEIEELLYRVKEKYKHIFKKPAETGELEISKIKLNPNIDEFRFGRNIGMLFHRARVARELTYTLQSYQKNVLNTFFKKGTKEYEEIEEEILITHKELDEDIELMDNWFKKGLVVLENFLPDYMDSRNNEFLKKDLERYKSDKEIRHLFDLLNK